MITLGNRVARINTNNTVETIARALRRAFRLADCPDDIEPVFREAAEGEGDDDGAKWHGMCPIGIPGAKFHAMTGQTEASNDVRRSRVEGKSYRNKVIDRADYYDSFDKVNSLKM